MPAVKMIKDRMKDSDYIKDVLELVRNVAFGCGIVALLGVVFYEPEILYARLRPRCHLGSTRCAQPQMGSGGTLMRLRDQRWMDRRYALRRQVPIPTS